MLRLGVSLRTRLTLWYGALLALTLLAFSALLYFTLQQSLSSSMDQRLVLRADQVAESLTPFENTMAAVARLLLTAGVLALALAVIVGWLLTRAALSPVARITETARHIAATGDYRQRLHVTPPRFGHGDELFFLAATFNDMIARLEHVLESQRRLLADTSHELRNPITIIRGNLALLRRAGVPEATRGEAVVEAEEEAARMGRLVGDLLLLARADAGEPPTLQREPVDLAELATEVVERARPQAADRRLKLAIEGSCTVLGDRDRLKQLIANLVENAVRYTPTNGRIEVVLTGAFVGQAASVKDALAGRA